ncbi:ABC transporter permease [Cellulomonas soli]|uniref:ABC transporter permease n=1 Tax=Cellulomonas soli TaxID=931535 RepID=UPI003F82D4B8
MTRVALRGIRAHVVRFVLSLLAVALGVAFVAGTFALRTMLSSTFDGIVEASAQGDVFVRGSQDTVSSSLNEGNVGEVRNEIPIALTETIEKADGVQAALAQAQGPIVLVGADGTAVQSTQAPSFAYGWSDKDRSMTLVEGRAPQGPDEILLEQATLESSGLAVGDTTTVVLGGEVRTVEVVGEAQAGGPMAGATIVAIDADIAEALYAPHGTVPIVTVYGEPGADQQQLADAVSAVLGGEQVEVVTGDAMREELSGDIQTMLGFITTFLLVFAGISLFVGAFIITNTFAMSVRERMREFALLRAIGASPAQVFTSVLVQAAMVGLLGAGLGILGGFGLVEAMRGLLESMGMDLAGDLPVDAFTIVVSLVVGTVVSLVAAALPARRAALVPPVEAMRDEVSTKDGSLTVRAIIGGALVAFGAGGVLTAVLRPEADAAGTLLGLGAAGVLIGVLTLAPVLARRVLGVLAAPAVLALRPIGRLARGNVVRNPRRTASTAGALMIGMALVGAAAVIAASTQASTKSLVEQEADTDLVLQSAQTGAIPAQAIDELRDVADVASVEPFAAAQVLAGDGGTTLAVEDATIVVGLDPAMFGTSLIVDEVDGDPAVALADGQVAVQKATAEDRGWSVGDEVTVQGSGGEATYTVGAVFESHALGTELAMAQDDLDGLVPADQQIIQTAFVNAAEGADLAAVRADVTQVVKPYVVISVMDTDEFISSLADQVNQVLVILYALLGLSVIIAVLGIVNTLALSVIERTREIGLLRAVGLGRLQLAGTITVESVLTALFGTILGLAVGVGLAATLPTVFAEQGLSTLAIPWSSLGVMVALALLVGVVAALWPAIRAARLPVLDAVASE